MGFSGLGPLGHKRASAGLAAGGLQRARPQAVFSGLPGLNIKIRRVVAKSQQISENLCKILFKICGESYPELFEKQEVNLGQFNDLVVFS